MKKIITILLTLAPFLTKAQVTLIPDTQFEAKLINMGIDSDGVINGQILTSDAQNTTNLNLSYAIGYGISNFAGLGAFSNLEYFETSYNNTQIVDFSNLTKLKKLVFFTNGIPTIDVSNNTELDRLVIGNGALDLYPHNLIQKLDVSNNNKLEYIGAFNLYSLKWINLRNHTAPKIFIELGNEMNPEIPYNVCIEVDDPTKATNKQAPYDKWTIQGKHYFNDVCTLNIEKFVVTNFKIYPNPTSDHVVIEQIDTENIQLQSVQIIDNTGKFIRTVKENFNYINVSNLSAGTYLFVIQTNKGNKTEKVIIK